LDHLRRDCLLSRRFQHRGGARGIGLSLVADRLEARDALLQRRVVEIGDAGLDGVIEPFQPQIGFGCALVQLGDVLAAAPGALLPTVEDGSSASTRGEPGRRPSARRRARRCDAG